MYASKRNTVITLTTILGGTLINNNKTGQAVSTYFFAEGLPQAAYATKVEVTNIYHYTRHVFLKSTRALHGTSVKKDTFIPSRLVINGTIVRDTLYI